MDHSPTAWGQGHNSSAVLLPPGLNAGGRSQSGRIQFRTVNLDGPGNEHFIQAYRLISKIVIVSDLAKGQEVRWENLQDVWTKQRDDGAFEAYVVDALRRHLSTAT